MSERVFNVLAGLSVLSWAVLGITADGVSTGVSVVRVCITLLHLSVGLLLLTRRPAGRQGTPLDVLLSLPSLVVCGLALKLAPSADGWPLTAVLVFALGTVTTLVSFLYLGRCFAVLPAVRGIVLRGPYRIVRHPAYAGELLMVLGCCSADPRLAAVCVLLAAFPCVVMRIRMEEKLLGTEATYLQYTQETTWRLLPGVW